jgi:hypothetical protein
MFYKVQILKRVKTLKEAHKRVKGDTRERTFKSVKDFTVGSEKVLTEIIRDNIENGNTIVVNEKKPF